MTVYSSSINFSESAPSFIDDEPNTETYMASATGTLSISASPNGQLEAQLALSAMGKADMEGDSPDSFSNTGSGTTTPIGPLAGFTASWTFGTLSVGFSGNLSGSQIVGTLTITDTTSEGKRGSFTSPTITLSATGAAAGATADMILRRSDGSFQIYDIGNDAIVAAFPLGQVGPEWKVAGVGNFIGTDQSDMILRNSAGMFEFYDIRANMIASAVSMGQVGMEWQVAGFGGVNGDGSTDMMLRNGNTGTFELYNVQNGQIASANAIGQVGLEWKIAGIGNFNGSDTTDMILRNSRSGAFEVYDVSNHQLMSAASLGQVGLEWQVAGFGKFAGDGTTDMMLRNTKTGAFEVYDIRNNQITSASALGQVGLEWQVAGFGPLDGAGMSDMVLRNTMSGAFEVYDIGANKIVSAASLGSIGTEWQVAGFAADPPTMGASLARFVQAMSAFPTNGGAASVPLNQPGQDANSQLLAVSNPLHHTA
jgi:hypothetical protein